jgi:hypothetical protein
MIIGAKWRCHKPSINFYPGEMSDHHFDRFSDILLTFIGFLHIPEHIYLTVYLYKFIEVYINWEESYRKDIRSEMISFVCHKSKKKNVQRVRGHQSDIKKFTKMPRVLLNGIVLMLMLSVALTLPSMSIANLHIHRNTTEEHCNEKLAFVQHSLMYAFHGMSFFTNTVVALTRCLMVFFTVMIGVMWRRVEPRSEDCNSQRNCFSKALNDGINLMDLADNRAASDSSPRVSECETNPQQSGRINDPQEPEHEAEINLQELAIDQYTPHKVDWEAVCCRHSRHIVDYNARKKNVFPIYKIFQSFFVLQWIIHLAGLFCHIANLLRPWVRNGQIDHAIVTHQIYELLHVLYNGLALVISYICALKMNAYLRRYVRDVQEKQLEAGHNAKSTVQYSLTHLFLIKVESVSKSSFLPRIPGTGLSISVENPGFVLSIVLCVFGLIGALI